MILPTELDPCFLRQIDDIIMRGSMFRFRAVVCLYHQLEILSGPLSAPSCLNIDVISPPKNPTNAVANGRLSLVASGLSIHKEKPMRTAWTATVKTTIFSNGENPHQLLKLLSFRHPMLCLELVCITASIQL